MIKLIDAIHSLRNVNISYLNISKANALLVSFVEEFETHYGAKNMVYNVHQLTHLAKCVEMNGPLFVYANYPMEDNIGHLSSFVRRTTDVTSQICSRYLLEKNLHISLQTSPLAQSFYKQIERKLQLK